MPDPIDEGSQPLAVLSDADLQRFVDDDRVPVDVLRIISGGIMGAISLAFAATAIVSVVGSVLWFGGLTIMLTSWLAAAISSAFAWGFGRAAWTWAHSRSPIDATLTPAEERAARVAFNAERVSPRLLGPTPVPPSSTATTDRATRKR